ncbi:MAG: NADH-quinone oxidoreductase subunit H [Verrucomicrobia bacterium]|nr:NADH-quinone oxidoreductase subunit H [Verrucomicrobiota bacterium]MBU4247645.1 NADH-quinone oxidoreductase subunit H [Verrucomicrobiota bacterium]MBU4292417.1 NADH-quinone oxidoreductase subunit H [Verrucomicrobiota bacterium]MBU4428404.1 NADH-quinone oxidoreductase subunit H [Verrucomicrobiota bacterium]MCG2680906.1 NADH-quinone oxidoreductase subunit H [Kiritimatiellia bacterium]
MNVVACVQTVLVLLLAPLLPGVINRTKAFFAGRQGPPVLQLYFDLWKLAQKGAVYSRTTTWVFRAGPIVGLAAVLVALFLTPFGKSAAPLAFGGDLILFAYLLGLMRFMTVMAALDTGSSFEGMGASREAFFSMLAEPAFLIGLVAVARVTGSLSLSGMLANVSAETWLRVGPALVLIAAAWMVILLAENSRIPVDDPNTHLELTMIHEVMVLDHGGPDFAAILYGAALKLWVMGALLVSLLIPVHPGVLWKNGLMFLGGMFLLAVGIGVVESIMARLRLARVPQLLMGAMALAALAMMLVLK